MTQRIKVPLTLFTLPSLSPSRLGFSIVFRSMHFRDLSYVSVVVSCTVFAVVVAFVMATAPASSTKPSMENMNGELVNSFVLFRWRAKFSCYLQDESLGRHELCCRPGTQIVQSQHRCFPPFRPFTTQCNTTSLSSSPTPPLPPNNDSNTKHLQNHPSAT